ncbi:hypothetical protein NQ318_013027 [Aromia moschata]|uniref:Mos1 transposase HTH domain-containing protein n=1 Tax=Aromia moschata TaxID=1265417 RepID=A0AAV8Y4C1_9CUCU|nr:hypothetical protein NQ318_013027 [Aromia moschata]
MLSVQMEQRVNLKFLVKRAKSFTEACAMLKEVYGNECLSHTQVFEWFKRFKEGRETTKDDPRPGRHSTSKNERTKTLKKLVKSAMKEARFECVEAVNAKATEVLNQLTEADFQQCFQQWKSRMEWCRDRQGQH